ncbi:CAP domain-containing protein [Halomonas sp. FeN2]|nr:CAP domain-containing protein [Halomonas sp. FeN2]
MVEGWLDSPGHCRNIMNDAFTEMGMAKAEDSESRYSTYWTQTLGNPR